MKLKLGFMVFFDVKVKKKHIYFRFFGIPLYRQRNDFFPQLRLDNEISEFDVRHIDEKIACAVNCKIKNPVFMPDLSAPKIGRVAFLVTELYDTGGHTECLKNIVSALHNTYEMAVFCSKFESTKRKAPQKYSFIKEKCSVFEGVEYQGWQNVRMVKKLFNYICTFSPRVVIVFMHMDDSLAAAVLYLLKKYTKTRILYFNHGSHFPALGFSFADASLECLPSAEKITIEQRKFPNCIRISLPSSFESDNHIFSVKQLNDVRSGLELTPGWQCTVSGGAAYKFFEGQHSSYFEFIRGCLEKRSNLEHVIVTDLNEQQKTVIDQVFSEKKYLLSRLKVVPTTVKYQSIFKVADVFIDSFPVGAALTQIDLMRLKVPSVVKINTESPMHSFHEYMPADYPFMSSDLTEIQRMTFLLLDDESLRRRVVEDNYRFFLNNYEGKAVRRNFTRVIESF